MSDWHVTRISRTDRERLEKLCVGKCKPPSVITALLNFAEAMGVVGVEILPGPEDGAKIPVVIGRLYLREENVREGVEKTRAIARDLASLEDRFDSMVERITSDPASD